MVGFVNSTWDVYVLTRARPIYYLYKGQLSLNSTKKNQVFVIQLTSLWDNLLFDILWGNLGYIGIFITLKKITENNIHSSAISWYCGLSFKAQSVLTAMVSQHFQGSAIQYLAFYLLKGLDSFTYNIHACGTNTCNGICRDGDKNQAARCMNGTNCSSSELPGACPLIL